MSKGVVRRYSRAVKLNVVEEIEAGRLTVSEAQRRFGIRGNQTVYNWLKAFGSHRPTTVYVQMKDEQDPLTQRDEEIRRLKAEKQALESALAQKDLKLLLAESAIEVAEEHFGCETGFIKKNFGRKWWTKPESK